MAEDGCGRGRGDLNGRLWTGRNGSEPRQREGEICHGRRG